MLLRPKADELDRLIDENLKLVYEELTGQPVPDRFMRLLRELRDSSQREDQWRSLR